MKICRNCQVAQPEANFYSLKTGKGGLNPWCRSCAAERARLARKADPDRMREQERARYAKDKSGKAAAIKRWYEKNRDKRASDMAARYQAKRAEILAQKAEYRASNRERIYVLNGQRRAAEKRAMPSWADRDAMAAMYREARRLTKSTGILHHVDHVYPLKHRHFCGLHVETNMQIITAEANMKKGNKWPQ